MLAIDPDPGIVWDPAQCSRNFFIVFIGWSATDIRKGKKSFRQKDPNTFLFVISFNRKVTFIGTACQRSLAQFTL